MILATDGDFNVGVTSQGDLVRLIEKERERGTPGTATMPLDSLHEARRVLVAQAGSTLVTVARDVKTQVEFNPAAVAAYRLIGYEKRLLQREDFNNDKKDAGEMGAGHSVTALYQIVPAARPSTLLAEFVRLIELAGSLSAQNTTARHER